MTRTLCLTLLAATTLAACSSSTPEQQTVNSATEALGGRDRIQAVKTLVIEGTGTQGNLGQDVTPDATGQRFTVIGRQERDRRRRQPCAHRADADAGLPVLRRPGGAAASQRPRRRGRLQRGAQRHRHAGGDASPATGAPSFFHHPLLAVRAALTEGADVSNPRTENGQNVVDVRTAAASRSRWPPTRPRTCRRG